VRLGGVLVETSIHYSKLLGVTPPQYPLMGPSDPRHSDDLIITPPSFNIVPWTLERFGSQQRVVCVAVPQAVGLGALLHRLRVS